MYFKPNNLYLYSVGDDTKRYDSKNHFFLVNMSIFFQIVVRVIIENVS